jgi:DNA-binding LytR/AlgR family response regulator
MKVLVVQSSKERKNRIPDFPDNPQTEGKWKRVSSVQEAIDSIKLQPPGLVILDVEIENGSGFKVFEETVDVTYDKIVLTESPGHVLKSIRFNVLEYLLKPMDPEAVQDAVQAAMFKQRKYGIQRLYDYRLQSWGLARPSHIFVPLRNMVMLVDVAELMLVEDVGRKRRLHMDSGEVLETHATWKRMCQLLKGHDFDLLEKGILFHAQHVMAIKTENEQTWAVLRTGRRLAISFKMEQRIRNKWKKYNIRPPYPDSH